MPPHSYRSAPRGFNLDAFHAGYRPPSSPVATPKPHPKDNVEKARRCKQIKYIFQNNTIDNKPSRKTHSPADQTPKMVNPAKNKPEIKNRIIVALFCRIARVVGLSSKISVFSSELKTSKLDGFMLKKWSKRHPDIKPMR